MRVSYQSAVWPIVLGMSLVGCSGEPEGTGPDQIPPVRERELVVFLEPDGSVSDGPAYAYMPQHKQGGATALGLLCRMRLGWQPDHPALINGGADLAKKGPSKSDMYYNYHATQVMVRMADSPDGGKRWWAWKQAMQDYLVGTQSTDGDEAGSWFFEDCPYGSKGGRLYHTAWAVMILEIRHDVPILL